MKVYFKILQGQNVIHTESATAHSCKSTFQKWKGLNIKSLWALLTFYNKKDSVLEVRAQNASTLLF